MIGSSSEFVRVGQWTSQPLTFVFILIIVFCAGWCSALWFVTWWRKPSLRKQIMIKTAEVTKHWSVYD